MNNAKDLKIKLKKITFKRYDSHKVKSLKESWRKPKRRSTRARLELKGKIRLVKIGYRSPKELRNKTIDGKEIIYVNSLSQLNLLDPKKHALIVAKLGKKKKIALLKKIIETGFEVLNYDPNEKLKELEKINEFENKKEQEQKESKEKKENKGNADKDKIENKEKDEIKKKVKNEVKENKENDNKKSNDKKEDNSNVEKAKKVKKSSTSKSTKKNE